MASRRIFVSPGSEERVTLVRDWMISRKGETVVLADSKGAVDDLVRSSCRRSGGLAGVHRFTPAQLAAILATPSLAEKRLSPVGSLGQVAIAARCVQKALERVGLSYFEPVSRMPGFARALSSTISDLRAEKVESEVLRTQGKPGRDLAVLLDLFVEELHAQQLADIWELFSLATRSAPWEVCPIVGKPLAFLDLGNQSYVARQFLSKLADTAPSVLATVPFGDEKGIRLMQDLLGIECEQALQDSSSQPSLHRVRVGIFEAGETPASVQDESFRFFSAPGEGRECVEIARRILSFAGDGIRFDQTAVLLRDPLVYQPQLQDAFSRARIPSFFSRGTIRPDPAGRAMLVLLDCAAEGLTASRFAEFLSLGQVPTSIPEGPAEVPWVAPSSEVQMVFKTAGSSDMEMPEVQATHESPVIEGTLRTPVHWERLLVDAAVIGGKARWVRRLNGLDKELRLKQSSAEGEVSKARLEDQLERLGNLKAFALPIIDSLDRLPDSARWGEWLGALRQLSILALRKPESVLELLTELQPMEKVGPVDLSEVREVLADRLTSLRVEPPAQRYGRVFVGTLEEAAGRCFQIVFLPGLAEGIMPKKVLEDPLMLDEARIKVGEGLLTRQDKAERERLLLRLGAGAASHHLIASYPRMDVTQGRARVPSLYALELLKAAEGSLPDLGTLERWAAEDTNARLGWPAPRDAKDAIDTAEYDLSILEPILHSSETATEGRGRFLLEVNPYLSRSMRARYKRWLGSWSDDDGIVASHDPKVMTVLSEHRLTRRSYSPTALQNYAACPYRFFLYGIHRLQPRQEITTIEQMDPLIRGSLFHEVQFELFRRLDRNGPASWGEVDVGMILDQADEVLDEVAALYREDLAPAIPRIWESEVEDLRVDLRCWVRDVTRKDQEWTPVHSEFSFGLPISDNRDPGSRAEVAEILDGIQLRGAIDLIERNEARGTIRVTDHKTGRAPTPAPKYVGNGEVLQPLLYGLAAEVLLEEEVEAAQLFYCTQRGDFKRYHFDLSGEARKSIRQIIDAIDRALARGFLPAAPREGACTYCDYRPVCGPYEELRVTRKPRQPIAELEAIRRIP